ncbi:MAG TPA: ornithine cyclodeaminase family protein [Dehalococcoidia bacterium]|nr:ornithine cyclodeaminase family protein [Dehalococcoidia bacterium]
MTLLLNNDDVKSVLTMPMVMEALEDAYRQTAAGDAICRPRIDLCLPNGDGDHVYQWGTMEGGSSLSGYFAIRIKSDVVYEQEYGGVRTQEKYCLRPGLFCGLILLTSVLTGEPLAILNDGELQHLRVGADSGIGVKLMARESAEVVGMLGSGGMARSHIPAFLAARPSIRRVQVYSPTREHREAYAREIAAQYELEAVAVDDPREAFRGADIVAGCTDSAIPLPIAEWLEPGAHVVSVGGRPDDATFDRIDVWLRLGTAPAPVTLPEWGTPAESVAYAAQPDNPIWASHKMMRHGGAGSRARDARARVVSLEDLLSGRSAGRTSGHEITFSERGNLQGAQFWAVAGKVYEAARQRGLGHELPTEWFLQDIRD